jgi:hypothetical protein
MAEPQTVHFSSAPPDPVRAEAGTPSRGHFDEPWRAIEWANGGTDYLALREGSVLMQVYECGMPSDKRDRDCFAYCRVCEFLREHGLCPRLSASSSDRAMHPAFVHAHRNLVVDPEHLCCLRKLTTGPATANSMSTAKLLDELTLCL